ncbi:thiol-activated cytolysin family protein [Chitinophaga oryzae]|uniref:Thiol-activated cytolysin family protein n=1 Tax=Chitinophaga oryzae TaxID=2725414 RepID=A0AAE7D6M6_9BACT|nr:thiol-activated cytolysin family protein [Chitinophaga oryzae]QJB31305.1 thiol-activated cytolysin family protein [Chitinophaga oryzae]QJB37791.1 thiol-activated cytolysin family protein [Chitinophaga oryzae]
MTYIKRITGAAALLLLILSGCKKHNDVAGTNSMQGLSKVSLPTIELKAHNYLPGGIGVVKFGEMDPNTAANEVKTNTVELRDSIWTDGFGKTVIGVSDEISISQTTHLQRAFAGSLIQGNSINDLTLKPIATYQSKVKPLKVSVSFPAKRVSGVISNVSLSGTRSFISDIMYNNQLGNQYASYGYSMERFTSYDEIKTAFGSNVNTRALFYKSSSSSSGEEHRITKRSGIYVRFVQRNFTIDVDLPDGGNLMDPSVNPADLAGMSPTYVSSITYGRMGIMSIESDSSYEATYEAFNKAYKALFVSGSSYLTESEKRIIDHADMRLFLVGTDGEATVKSVLGFDAFLKVAQEGQQFSADKPGVPIYFSLSNLSDHSLVKQTFRVSVYTDPVYARMETEGVKTETARNWYGDQWEDLTKTKGRVFVRFYSDVQATKPTNPPLFVRFNYKVVKRNVFAVYGMPGGSFPYEEKTTEEKGFCYNVFRITQYPLADPALLEDRTERNRTYQEDTMTLTETTSTSDEYTYVLLPGDFYKVLTPVRR